MKLSQENIKNILIIRSGAIGDVLMSIPLAEAIRNKWTQPNTKISYLVGKWSASVLKNNPDIDEVISFDDRIIVKKNAIRAIGLANKLRKKNFDTCFILDKSWLWSAFVKLVGIPFTVGFQRNGKKAFNTINIPFSADKYELDYYLDIARALSLRIKSKKMKIYPSKADESLVKKLNISKIISKNSNKTIGIAPGGAENPGQTLPAKRWPLRNYANLIKKLAEKDYTIMLFGGKSDEHICDRLKKISQAQITSLAGKTSIQQSYLLMKNCKYFVTHDSGPMHIAAAAGLGKNLIAIFGPTSPERFAPRDATVLKPKKLPLGYNPEQDVYRSLDKSQVAGIEYAGVEDVLRIIK